MDVVLPVPFTPTMRITVGLPFAWRMSVGSIGKICAISSRTALITSPIPSTDQASRSCSVLIMRVVIGTPRSARMSASSSSSQSIGLPANCWASASRNFMSIFCCRAGASAAFFGNRSGRPTIPSSQLPAPADPSLCELDRESHLQTALSPRHHMSSPVRSLR